MLYNSDGSIWFQTRPEMYYDLFMEIGLGIKDQYLYDQDNGTFITLKEKYIKANIDGSPLYPGRNDIVFEPDKNYTLIEKLFCFYLDKCKDTEDGDILQGYIAHYIDDNPTKDKQKICVKTVGRGIIESEFYTNIYLAYIDVIFRIAGYRPNLSNFDVVI